MGKIKKFKLYWADAWGFIQYGCDSTIEITEEGKTIILFMVNMEPFSITLGDKENEFLQVIKNTGIEKLNGYGYDSVDICDGDQWRIDIIADELDVFSAGHNTCPNELKDLLVYLHEKWNLPICKIAEYYYRKSSKKLDRYGKRHKLSEKWRMYYG